MKISEMMRTYRKSIVIGLLVLLALGGAGWVWFGKRGTEPAYREVKLSRGDLEVTILSTGVVQPQNRLEIKAPIPGRADEVLVDEGYKVKKGQILVWMSSTERAALLDAARAKGTEEVKRWEDIYRATPILAPITGTIILRSIEPGQTFTSSDAVLVMSDRLTIKAQVDETDIGQIKLGQQAKIVLDAYPNQPFVGKVDQIAYDSKTVNNVTTYVVDVLPEKIPDFMRSGMTANVSFVTASRRDVVLVPTEAIRVRNGQMQVLVRETQDDAKPTERKVELGLNDGRRTEVIAGLAEGDRVLVPQMLKAGKASGSSPLTPSFGGGRR